MYYISSDLYIDRLREEYLRTSMVQVPNFLQAQSASDLFSFLQGQKEWNLSFNKLGSHTDISFSDYCGWNSEQKSTLKDIVWSQAGVEFQYFYKSIPIFDFCNHGYGQDERFLAIFNLVNSQSFLSLMRSIVGDQSISFADVQATCFDRGHFLKEHDDGVLGKNRVAAYVINLTPGWDVDWGGILHFYGKENIAIKGLVPTFNAVNVFKVPQKHSVSYVTPFARGSRYSITGWLRRGQMTQ
ncbi:2OG-Fe(II) oxygenase [Microbulbifer variabilis]|uniref:2OG-Fe(II) oxygenase n=1 Tax=Microbulbifer variabilis TaxID=266805 RepID=UPI001CFE4416|nr:2OG-Fe(II) oxygenase family protein [Microbulbifer variabilis]